MQTSQTHLSYLCLLSGATNANDSRLACWYVLFLLRHSTKHLGRWHIDVWFGFVHSSIGRHDANLWHTLVPRHRASLVPVSNHAIALNPNPISMCQRPRCSVSRRNECTPKNGNGWLPTKHLAYSWRVSPQMTSRVSAYPKLYSAMKTDTPRFMAQSSSVLFGYAERLDMIWGATLSIHLTHTKKYLEIEGFISPLFAPDNKHRDTMAVETTCDLWLCRLIPSRLSNW